MRLQARSNESNQVGNPDLSKYELLRRSWLMEDQLRQRPKWRQAHDFEIRIVAPWCQCPRLLVVAQRMGNFSKEVA